MQAAASEGRSAQDRIETLKALILAGASTTVRDNYGLSAVHHAAIGGRVEAVEYLLDPITVAKGTKAAPDRPTFTREPGQLRPSQPTSEHAVEAAVPVFHMVHHTHGHEERRTTRRCL